MDTIAERRVFLECIRELANQRAADHRAARLRMDFRRWEEEFAELQMKSEHRRVWEPFKFHELMTNQEDMARILTKGMTPEREDAFREFLRMSPRKRTAENGTPHHPPNGSTAPSVPTKSD